MNHPGCPYLVNFLCMAIPANALSMRLTSILGRSTGPAPFSSALHRPNGSATKHTPRLLAHFHGRGFKARPATLSPGRLDHSNLRRGLSKIFSPRERRSPGTTLLIKLTLASHQSRTMRFRLSHANRIQSKNACLKHSSLFKVNVILRYPLPCRFGCCSRMPI